MADGTSATPASPAAIPSAAPAATPATPAPAAATPAPAAPPIAWLPEANEELVGYVQNKGFDSPAKVLDSYRNLEQKFGADRAGRTVVMPQDGADPTEMAAFYDKLGRPTEPSKYEIPVPNGQDGKFATEASQWFHDAGLSKKQGQALAEKWNAHVEALTAAQKQEAAAKNQADAAALEKTWGEAHAQNLALAQQTRKALNVSDAEVDAISSVLGLKRTVEMFHQLGTRTGEADFTRGAPGSNGVMTPGQAQARISELRTDRDFASRYTRGDKAAVAEMTRLHQLAYPERKK